MAYTKWDCEMTIKFIQAYKCHPCLWDFQSVDYKNKQKREDAYIQIVEAVNINRFGVHEVKNKIKNLRSTYCQELKKIQDSKRSGAGVSNVYTPNIKWLKEIEEVFNKNLNRKTYENNNQLTNDGASVQESGSEEAPAATSVTIPITSATTTHITSTNENINTRPKKRSRDVLKAIADLKSLNEQINTEEGPFDIFGKNVAMQLKTLSVENALLAQSQIQNILTEFGIRDYREKTASQSRIYNNKNQRDSSILPDATDVATDICSVPSPVPVYLFGYEDNVAESVELHSVAEQQYSN